jgi:hypothetical protein
MLGTIRHGSGLLVTECSEEGGEKGQNSVTVHGNTDTQAITSAESIAPGEM